VKLNDINVDTLKQLDCFCGGVLSQLKAYCTTYGHEAHLTVLTHFEGLKKDEMQFHIEVTHDGKVIDRSLAIIRGAAKEIGWSLYVKDLLEFFAVGTCVRTFSKPQAKN
jgi:hypothetical protein